MTQQTPTLILVRDGNPHPWHAVKIRGSQPWLQDIMLQKLLDAGFMLFAKKIHMGRAEYENNGYSRPSDSILARAPKNIVKTTIVING